MKAKEANFLSLLREPKQFTIPIFQRTYSWTEKQCEQLWNDIVRVARDDSIPGHFVGSIVYITGGIFQATAIPQLLVIDGQQRLTTLSLLLAAIRGSFDEKDGEAAIDQRRINNYYLFNAEESGSLRYKLQLTRSDKDTFVKIVEDGAIPESASPRIVANYHYFQRKLAESGVTAQEVFNGIAKLIIVDVSLDRTQDNPQLIFESMNSTGLDLTQADLIRNFVLMGLEPKLQTSLYENHWFPMEQSFGSTHYGDFFDRFMRDYLTVKSKSGAIPRIKEVYVEFKRHIRDNGSAIPDAIQDVHKFSNYFVRMVLSRETDAKLAQLFAKLVSLDVDVAYPFLLEVYDDFEQKRITEDELIEILRIVESYVFRRAVCGIPTNSLNRTFATLTREVDKNNYLESVKAVFLLKDSYRRFPGDDEFKREFVVKDLYHFKSRGYLLRMLENHDRKETVDVDTHTIEHVMPQNEEVSPEWRAELGPDWRDVWTRYLHTIGNLTLTGYNPELSDRSFLEKRDIKGGFADSPLRLNRGLAKIDHWNAQEIENRAAQLAELAVTIWPAPQLAPEVLSGYKKAAREDDGQTYTLDHFADRLQGLMADLFHQLRVRILNLDPSVREEFKKHYIAYKSLTNFVDIVPQRSRLRLTLNMPFSELADLKGICRDVSDVGQWTNGEVELGINALDQLDYVMSLISQSFDIQREEGD